MNMPDLSPRYRQGFIVVLAFLIGFSAFEKGAHDLWAATLVYLVLLVMTVGYLWRLPLAKEQTVHIPQLLPALTLLVAFVISFFRSINPSESFLGLMDWISCLLTFFLAA